MNETADWRKASYSNGQSECVEVGTWRKASHSNHQAQCVEVGGGRRGVLIRDTKQSHLGDAARTVVPFTARAWSDFTASLKK